MLDKFADELRKKREQSGITLHQMASKTKIDIKFLEALDEGNFAFLPELYVKAFIKQYAKVVGLDETESIKRYEAARDGRLSASEAAEPEIDKTVVKNVIPPPAKGNIQPKNQPVKSYNDPSVEKRYVESDNTGIEKLIITAVGGIIIILLLVYLFFYQDSEKIIIAERPIEDVIQDSKPRYVEETAETPDEGFVLSSDSLLLKFYSTDTSWIYVIIDNSRTEEFTLSPNTEHIVSAGNSFKATVGNSGAVKLSLNNSPVEFSGRKGSVRYFSLNREGLQYLNTPPKLDR